MQLACADGPTIALNRKPTECGLPAAYGYLFLSNIINTRQRPDRSPTEAYADLIGECVGRGWSPWLPTLMLHQIAGPSTLVRERMREGVESFYATLLTRVVRRPRSPSSLDSLPVLVGALDLPVRKRAKLPLSDWRVNGGLHAHGVLAVPPASRLPGSAGDHVAGSGGLYLQGGITRVDLRPIEPEHVDRVVRYALKAVLNDRLGDEDLVLLPRALSELP